MEEPAFDGYAQENKKGDPQYNPNGKWKFVSPTEDADWLNKSKIISAFPEARNYVLHAKRLQKDAPKIAAFLSNVAIDPDSLNGLIKQIEEKMDPAKAAKTWVEANKVTVDRWIAAAN